MGYQLNAFWRLICRRVFARPRHMRLHHCDCLSISEGRSGWCFSPLSSWPSWISARVRSHSRLGPEGQKGHLITKRAGETFLHLLISTRRPRWESQLNYCFGGQLEPSVIPLVNLSLSGCRLREARLITALLSQHCPGDPCQLVGESCGQNVGMEALSGASEPDPEAVLRPACRP
jgi:hypothetical protein